ncbi:MAG: dipicolinate synthase subunit B [Clostridiales bacterium]|jgi:dipicolinate synthase subunit B|nr:dipicolinate synthase subunit B [Clostridiales bacterium]
METELKLSGKKVGFALTGSFCTLEAAFAHLQSLLDAGADVYPIISENVAKMDTRFISANETQKRLKEMTGRDAFKTIQEAEPIGPKKLLDVLVILPCTGNTASKIANAITDTPVTMAAKAHLRNERPLIIAISTNDGLSANAKNIGALLNTRNVYFVPFYQDDPLKKTRSLAFYGPLLVDTILEAMKGKQIQPILHI